MDEIKKVETTEEIVGTTRRSIVKSATQVAITAPAVSLLLASTVKPALANLSAYQASANHVLDDFTFGNDHEDIDGKECGGYNCNLGTPAQDDAFVP
ncbi:MAG TPA: hypothetical protein VFI23_11920 [Rhizomicrobium sp.]|nr:hypothetical protein [Rhizomicrobium sp.]